MGKAKIFLSYAKTDKKKVEKLYRELSRVGLEPWMDKENIFGGEEWLPTIQKAIRESAVFLACLSPKSVDKRGALQREIKQALDIWQEKLDDDIYLIPVRLKNCEVPDALRKFQWVDLYENDGFARLEKAIREGIKRRDEKPKHVAKTQIKTNVRIEKSKTRSAMQKSSNRKSSAKRSSAGNASTKTAANDRQIANPNIWIKEHKMRVDVKLNKRIVKHEYLLSAYKKDADLYRFKLNWTGSGKTEVTKEPPTPNEQVLDDKLVFFGVNDENWEHYAVVFSQALRIGKEKPKPIKAVILTFESTDDEQVARPLQGLSYTDVAGCDKLSMTVKFFYPLTPKGIKVMKCDHNWNENDAEDVNITQEDTDERTRIFSFNMTPKRDVKYKVKWPQLKQLLTKP